MLDRVIAAVNEHLGGNLTDADKVWVQRTFEYTAEDRHIREAAQANTKDNFAHVLDKQVEGLVLDLHEADANRVTRVFKDTDTPRSSPPWSAASSTNSARQAGEAV